MVDSNKLNSFRDLIAWQKAMALTQLVYRLTDLFPQKEIYSLTSQVRRAAISVPANIAEGRGRGSRKEFRQFVYYARGSLSELITLLELAERLGFAPLGDCRQFAKQATELEMILNGLLRALSTKKS